MLLMKPHCHALQQAQILLARRLELQLFLSLEGIRYLHGSTGLALKLELRFQDQRVIQQLHFRFLAVPKKKKSTGFQILWRIFAAS